MGVNFFALGTTLFLSWPWIKREKFFFAFICGRCAVVAGSLEMATAVIYLMRVVFVRQKMPPQAVSWA